MENTSSWRASLLCLLLITASICAQLHKAKQYLLFQGIKLQTQWPQRNYLSGLISHSVHAKIAYLHFLHPYFARSWMHAPYYIFISAKHTNWLAHANLHTLRMQSPLHTVHRSPWISLSGCYGIYTSFYTCKPLVGQALSIQIAPCRRFHEDGCCWCGTGCWWGTVFWIRYCDSIKQRGQYIFSKIITNNCT